MISAFLVLGTSCLGSLPSDVYREHAALLPLTDADSDDRTIELDGTLDSTLRYALKNSPEVESAYYQWRASELRVARHRRLPDPTLSYGYFLRSVQTRTGPQEQRFGVSQVVPLAGELTSAGKAASFQATAARRRFEATILALNAEVQSAYWRIWLVNEEQRLAAAHDQILENLVETVRARVRTGEASLAALAQVELNMHRHHDHTGAHKEALQAAKANLAATLGADWQRYGEGVVPSDSPVPIKPGLNATPNQLVALLQEHPLLLQQSELIAAAAASVKRERSRRFPKLRVGADIIDTGATPGAWESGENPIVLSLGASIPVWQGSYSKAIKASQAASAAAESQRFAILRAQESKLVQELTQTNDAVRRIRLLEGALVPSAEITYESTLGSYRVGRASIAEVLLAQRDLLELQIELARESARYAVAFARLESVVGHPLPLKGKER